MIDFSKWFRKTAVKATQGRRPRPAGRRVRLSLETFEDRVTPTVVIQPHFPGVTETSAASAHQATLQSEPVVLIFAGSFWQTAQGQQDQATLTNSVQALVDSAYLTGLVQYGGDGKATYFTSGTDAQPLAVVGNEPNGPDLLAYARAEIAAHPGLVPPTSANPQQQPLYFVINDPADSGPGPGTFGLNWNDGTLHTAYVGARSLAGGALDADSFTQVFSHELAEATASAVAVSDPGGLNEGSQIADNEPEQGPGYTYRVNGVKVQAYWSAQDSAWIIPDGSSTQTVLSPIWSNGTFTGNYNTVTSGQVGINAMGLSVRSLILDGQRQIDTSSAQSVTLPPGVHTLSTTSGAAVSFTVNADGTVSYDPALGQAGILAGQGTTQLTVNGAAVTLDATALTAPSVLVDYSTTENTGAALALRVLPGSHLLEGPGGTGALWFTVNADGTVSYDPALGQAGILAGQGTTQLTVNGAAVTLDATALTTPSLAVDYIFNNPEKTAGPFTLHLLPGSHLLEGPGGTGAVAFTVDPDGTVSYDQPLGESGILAGQGSRQLTVHGAAVTVDATALTAPGLVTDYDFAHPVSTAARFTLHLLPGSHVLEGTNGGGGLSYTVNPDGSVSFPTSEDAQLSLLGSTDLIVKALSSS
jgi:phage baseplate assembly protein gpV